MNRNFPLKLKKIDLIFIVISVILSLVFFFMIFLYDSFSNGERYLNVYYQNQKIEELYIRINNYQNTERFVIRKKNYPNLIDDFYVEVNEELGIRAIDEDCPNKECEKMNWVNVPNLEIVCIPNNIRMYISVLSSSYIVI